MSRPWYLACCNSLVIAFGASMQLPTVCHLSSSPMTCRRASVTVVPSQSLFPGFGLIVAIIFLPFVQGSAPCPYSSILAYLPLATACSTIVSCRSNLSSWLSPNPFPQPLHVPFGACTG